MRRYGGGGGMKKNFLSQISNLFSVEGLSDDSKKHILLYCDHTLLFHAPPPVPLLKKVAESYGKNFGALKLVNF
jgi:hypothetical protein